MKSNQGEFMRLRLVLAKVLQFPRRAKASTLRTNSEPGYRRGLWNGIQRDQVRRSSNRQSDRVEVDGVAGRETDKVRCLFQQGDGYPFRRARHREDREKIRASEASFSPELFGCAERGSLDGASTFAKNNAPLARPARLLVDRRCYSHPSRRTRFPRMANAACC